MAAPRKTPTKTPTKRSLERAAAGRFVRSRKVYVLTFDDPTLDGLEVRARSVPVSVFLNLMSLIAEIDRADDASGPEVAAAFTGLCTGFTEALVSWNLDDRLDDAIVPVPATVEGVMDQDFPFVMQLIKAWLDAVGGVDAPLAPGSNGGDRTLEASLPMAASSPDPSS